MTRDHTARTDQSGPQNRSVSMTMKSNSQVTQIHPQLNHRTYTNSTTYPYIDLTLVTRLHALKRNPTRNDREPGFPGSHDTTFRLTGLTSNALLRATPDRNSWIGREMVVPCISDETLVRSWLGSARISDGTCCVLKLDHGARVYHIYS